jgi:serine/threonine protein kinase
VGKLEPAEAVRLAAEAAEAVHVLHLAGVVHRDVKPSNLLLDRTGGLVRVLVADLGSAKRLADASGFTVTTGTPAYMAPEQSGGLGGFDGRADVYSLAVVTWELLTGHRPAPGVRPSDGRGAGRQPSRRRPAAGMDGVDPRVVGVLTAALDTDPDARPRDARTFAESLVAAHAATDEAPSAGWSAWLVWAVALMVFALTVVSGWLVF